MTRGGHALDALVADAPPDGLVCRQADSTGRTSRCVCWRRRQAREEHTCTHIAGSLQFAFAIYCCTAAAANVRGEHSRWWWGPYARWFSRVLLETWVSTREKNNGIDFGYRELTVSSPSDHSRFSWGKITRSCQRTTNYSSHRLTGRKAKLCVRRSPRPLAILRSMP